MPQATVTLVGHALIAHKLTILRDRATDYPGFRRIIRELGLLMGAVATQTLPLLTDRVETPVAGADGAPSPAEGSKLENPAVVIIPILRAGLTMSDALQELLPLARIGHIGLFRKGPGEVLNYLVSVPVDPDTLPITTFFLVDPMIATGTTLSRALEILRDQGVRGRQTRVISLIASRTGLATIAANRANDDVEIFVAAIDDDMDDHRYIRPGLGDAGDRQFGTLKPGNPDLKWRRDIV